MFTYNNKGPSFGSGRVQENVSICKEVKIRIPCKRNVSGMVISVNLEFVQKEFGENSDVAVDVYTNELLLPGVIINTYPQTPDLQIKLPETYPIHTDQLLVIISGKYPEHENDKIFTTTHKPTGQSRVNGYGGDRSDFTTRSFASQMPGYRHSSSFGNHSPMHRYDGQLINIYRHTVSDEIDQYVLFYRLDQHKQNPMRTALLLPNGITREDVICSYMGDSSDFSRAVNINMEIAPSSLVSPSMVILQGSKDEFLFAFIVVGAQPKNKTNPKQMDPVAQEYITSNYPVNYLNIDHNTLLCYEIRPTKVYTHLSRRIILPQDIAQQDVECVGVKDVFYRKIPYGFGSTTIPLKGVTFSVEEGRTCAVLTEFPIVNTPFLVSVAIKRKEKKTDVSGNEPITLKPQVENSPARGTVTHAVLRKDCSDNTCDYDVDLKKGRNLVTIKTPKGFDLSTSTKISAGDNTVMYFSPKITDKQTLLLTIISDEDRTWHVTLCNLSSTIKDKKVDEVTVPENPEPSFAVPTGSTGNKFRYVAVLKPGKNRVSIELPVRGIFNSDSVFSELMVPVNNVVWEPNNILSFDVYPKEERVWDIVLVAERLIPTTQAKLRSGFASGPKYFTVDLVEGRQYIDVPTKTKDCVIEHFSFADENDIVVEIQQCIRVQGKAYKLLVASETDKKKAVLILDKYGRSNS